MARIAGLTIENYRSVCGPLSLRFPRSHPVVLIGENNVGKSNIAKALNLVLGNFWPGTHDPDDHEFFGRRRDLEIRIQIRFSGDDLFGERYEEITWSFDPTEKKPSFNGYPDRHGERSGWINNSDRDTCMCVLLEADRNLNYQLGYTSKYTLLSKLMHRFHRKLMDHPEIRTDLEDLFADVKERFQGIAEFAQFTEHLQTQLGDLVGTMTHRLEVDFEAYNPVNFFHALRLQAADKDGPRTLEEMGTGEHQILALSFAYAYARAFHGGIVLVIEEPESHLHPLAQQWLARKLTELCSSGLQMVITTHSPNFIDLLAMEGVVLLRKAEMGTRATQIDQKEFAEHCIAKGAPADRVSPDTILQFYNDHATPAILEGLFARGVALVEGPTEALTLPIYLGQVDFDSVREGLAIIAVHGKGNLGKWYRLFTAYGIPTYVIFDNDEEEDIDGSRRRDALVALGISDASAQARILAAEEFVVGTRGAVFGTNFETVMRTLVGEYSELEKEAKAAGMSGKPLIARWVAERVVAAHHEVLAGKLSELAEKLRTLLGRQGNRYADDT